MAVESAHFFWADSASLKTLVSVASRLPQPLVLAVRAKGYPKLGAFEMLRVVRAYYKGRDVDPVSD